MPSAMMTSSHASPRHRHPQERYKSIPGVVNTVVGYTGGTTANPTYNTVCRNDGHTEAIKVEFDPGVISYEELMRTFFSEAGRGGGKTQYQSAVWPQTDEQKSVAQRLADERHSTVRPLPTLTPTPTHTPTPTPNPDPSPSPSPNPNPKTLSLSLSLPLPLPLSRCPCSSPPAGSTPRSTIRLGLGLGSRGLGRHGLTPRSTVRCDLPPRRPPRRAAPRRTTAP